MTVTESVPASELVCGRLLEQIVRIGIESVSAERALVVANDGRVIMRATVNTFGEVTFDDADQVAQNAPQSAIEHVRRSGSALLLSDAVQDERFRQDPYFSTYHATAVLALPLDCGSNLPGVLYFENSVSPRAFSEDDLKKLRPIADVVSAALQNTALLKHYRYVEFKLRLLSQAGAALATSPDYQACLAKIGELVVSNIADWCIVDAIEGNKLLPVVCAHVNPEKAALLQALRQKRAVTLDSVLPQTAAIRSGKSLLVSNVTTEFVENGLSDEELQPHSIITVPLAMPERILGCATFVRSRRGHPFQAHDLEVTEGLGHQIAQVLQIAILHKARNEAKQECIERDRYLSMTFQQLAGAVWTADRDLRLSYVAGRVDNKTAGCPVAGMSLADFFGNGKPSDAAMTHHRAALAGEKQSFEYKFGGRWYAVSIEPLRDEMGQITGCVGAAFDITEQRATLERLGRGEARLAEAQRVAHIGSFEWDIVRNDVTWSDELHRIFGLKPGQFSGTYEAFLERFHPEDVALTQSVVLKAFRELKPFVLDYRIIRPDGRVRMLHTRASMITDENGKPVRLVGSAWDVTERAETIRDLKHARSLLEATIDATADGLLVVDTKGKVTAYNQKFLSLWRIPPQIVEKRDDERLLSFVFDQLEDPDGFLRRVHQLYGHPDQESFDVIRLKGRRVFERLSTPQRLGNHIVGRVWSFRDVTEREWLYRRAVFLAGDDVGGPATSIHTAVRALLKGTLSTEALSKVIEMGEREGRRLANLGDQLGDLDTIPSVESKFEEVNLADVVREVCTRLGPELARTGSSLSITNAGRPVGQWDRFRVHEVVRNLLSNAIKFGLGKPIEVRVSGQNGLSTLVIKDNGIGIPSEMLERIFDPFEQPPSIQYVGAIGLGLFIARKLVQAMGGSIKVESRLGVGSSFIVELPGVKL